MQTIRVLLFIPSPNIVIPRSNVDLQAVIGLHYPKDSVYSFFAQIYSNSEIKKSCLCHLL